MEEETGWKGGREGKTREHVSVLCVSLAAQLSVRRKKKEERERRRVRRKEDKRERRGKG